MDTRCTCGKIISFNCLFTRKLQQIVINQFTRVAKNDRCMFLGNVNLGLSVSLKELRDLYHVVSYVLHCAFSF